MHADVDSLFSAGIWYYIAYSWIYDKRHISKGRRFNSNSMDNMEKWFSQSPSHIKYSMSFISPNFKANKQNNNNMIWIYQYDMDMIMDMHRQQNFGTQFYYYMRISAYTMQNLLTS